MPTGKVAALAGCGGPCWPRGALFRGRPAGPRRSHKTHLRPQAAASRSAPMLRRPPCPSRRTAPSGQAVQQCRLPRALLQRGGVGSIWQAQVRGLAGSRAAAPAAGAEQRSSDSSGDEGSDLLEGLRGPKEAVFDHSFDEDDHDDDGSLQGIYSSPQRHDGEIPHEDGLPASVSARIAKASTLQQLEELIATERSEFGPSTTLSATLRLLKITSAGGGRPSEAALAALAQAVRWQCRSLTAIQLSVMARAFALLNYDEPSLWVAISKEVQKCSLSHFTTQSLVDLLWAYGHIGYMPGQQLLDAIAYELTAEGTLAERTFALADCLELAPQQSPQPVEAKVEDGETSLEDAMGQRPGRTPLDDFTSRELCMTMCAFAKMRHSPGRVLLGVSRLLSRSSRIAAMPGQEISMLLWAFAKLGERPTALLDLVATELQGRLQEDAAHHSSAGPPAASASASSLLLGDNSEWGHRMAPEQEAEAISRVLSSVVWAYGKLNHYPGGLAHAAASRCAPLMVSGLMPPKDRSRMVWGFARLGCTPNDFLSALAGSLVSREGLDDFRPIQVSIVLWSLAVLERQLPAEALETTACYLSANLTGLSAQGLSNIAWALNRLGETPRGTVAVLAGEAEGRIGEFTPQGLAELVAACAESDEAPESFLQTVSEHVESSINDFGADEVLSILISFTDLGFQSEAMLEAVRMWADQRLVALSPQGLSTTLWGFAYAGYRNDTLLKTAAEACLAKAPNFTPQHVARVLWSFAKLGYDPGELLPVLAERSLELLRQFAPKELTNVLWAYGRLQHHPGRLMTEAADWACPRLGTFSPQALANIAWAYARLDCPSARLMNLVASEAAGMVEDFQPQGLSMLVYALAILRIKHVEFLDEVSTELTNRDLSDFEPQNFANLLWGFAKLGVDPGPALDLIAEDAQERLPAFSSQELFNIVWACAKLRRRPEGQLLELLGQEVARRVEELTPQELANTAWAYARLREPHPRLLSALCKAAAPRLEVFSIQHLVNLLWALSQAGDDPEGIIPQLMRQLEGRVDELRPQHLAMVLRSLALLHLHPGVPFLSMVQEAAVRQQGHFRRYEICGLLWAYATLGVRPEKLLQLLQPGSTWASAMKKHDRVMPNEMVRALWAVVVLRQYRLPVTQWLTWRMSSPGWAGRGQNKPTDVIVMRDQAFRLLEAEFPDAEKDLRVWREGEQEGDGCHSSWPPAGDSAHTSGGERGSDRLLGETLTALNVKGQQVESGWLLRPRDDGSTSCILLISVQKSDLIKFCNRSSELLQTSGSTIAQQRLLLDSLPARPARVAALLEEDWQEACSIGPEGRRACLQSALRQAAPVDPPPSMSATHGPPVMQCRAGRILWRTKPLKLSR